MMASSVMTPALDIRIAMSWGPSGRYLCHRIRPVCASNANTVDASVPSHFVPCPGQLSWLFFRVTATTTTTATSNSASPIPTRTCKGLADGLVDRVSIIRPLDSAVSFPAHIQYGTAEQATARKKVRTLPARGCPSPVEARLGFRHHAAHLP